MTAKKLPSQERLLHLFSYNPETGELCWKNPTSNRLKPGDPAGRISRNRYSTTTVDGISYLNHRLIWLMVHGTDPLENLVDHVDGDCTNNRIDNLRLATCGQNRDNTKKAQGCSYDKTKGNWLVTVNSQGKRHYVGRFKCPLEARLAYEDKKRELCGEFSPC
jgi:hypothetical protein